MAILACLFFQMYFIILSNSTQQNESKNLGGIFIEFLFHRFNSRQTSHYFGTLLLWLPCVLGVCLCPHASWVWTHEFPGSPALLTPLPCHWCSICNFPVGPLACTHPWCSFLLSCLGHLHSMSMAPADLTTCKSVFLAQASAQPALHDHTRMACLHHWAHFLSPSFLLDGHRCSSQCSVKVSLDTFLCQPPHTPSPSLLPPG